MKYDSWGKVVEKSKNGLVSKFKYDHFGRLVEKTEGNSATKYTYDKFGNRLSRITNKDGAILDEYNSYDKFGRLSKTQSNGKVVEYVYNDKNQLSEQIIDGNIVKFEYTKLGQVASKRLYLKGSKNIISELKYFYDKSGKITSRLANGKLQGYKYDVKNQLLSVSDLETKEVLEEYKYDPSGNILQKTILGKTTTYTYDEANQLVSSVSPDGKETNYAYDAAGRMIQEGDKSYKYAWLDKVMQVSKNGKILANFEYHNSGQIAKAIRGSNVETFEWDGLALIERSGTKYINEPHAGGGNPVLAVAENTETIFTDILGTSLGTVKENQYSNIDKTSFGADSTDKTSFFTGKPYVEDLGYAFLMRNYRSDMGKWLSQDIIGYPDGWNNFAYCNNASTIAFDWCGALKVIFKNNGREITNANQASPINTNKNEAGPGNIVISQSSTHEIIVSIDMVLSVNSSIPRNSSYAFGSEITYVPHSNSMTDSYMSPGIYEAALAHERGHLQQFINYKSSLKVALQNQLNSMGIREDALLSSEILKNLTEIFSISVPNFYYSENSSRTLSIIRAANAPTFSKLKELGLTNVGGNKWKKGII